MITFYFLLPQWIPNALPEAGLLCDVWEGEHAGVVGYEDGVNVGPVEELVVRGQELWLTVHQHPSTLFPANKHSAILYLLN